MGRIICFDIETTGFEYMRGDRCIDIGAVEVVDGKITGNEFQAYINPEGKIIPPDTYEVHKISNAFLEDKPLMSEVAPKFLEFVGDSPIIAHNGSEFDFPFINHELKRIGLPEIPLSQQMDSMILARTRVYGPKSYSLDALAKWFGISLDSRADAHGALVDSRLLANVYVELESTAKPRPISEIMDEFHQKMLNCPKTAGDFPRRHFPASDADVAEHETFMDAFIRPKEE